MKKVTIEDDVGNAGNLNWLAPFVYSSNLSALNIQEVKSRGFFKVLYIQPICIGVIFNPTNRYLLNYFKEL